MSQSDLACAADLSLTTVNQAERSLHSPELATLEKIASVLNNSVAGIYLEGRKVALENDEVGRIRLAANLRKIRLSKSMTQLDVATASGLSLSTIANIETSRKAATVDVMGQISLALGIDISELLLPAD